jgi:hypothetical protein
MASFLTASLRCDCGTCRWYRDPSLPIHRTEITRFPHAVLEIKLSLVEGEEAPDWVAELVDSGGWIGMCAWVFAGDSLQACVQSAIHVL